MSASEVRAFSQHQCQFPECGNYNATKRCGRCKEAMYCGPVCQKAHWPQHKISCISPSGTKDSNAQQDSFELKKVEDIFASTKKPQATADHDKSRQAEKAINAALDGAKFSFFIQQNLQTGSPLALSEARKYAGLNQMKEAASFVSLMVKADQDIFLAEMASISGWKSVEVAAILFKSKRGREGMEMMESFPDHKATFLALIRNKRMN